MMCEFAHDLKNDIFFRLALREAPLRAGVVFA